MAQTVSSMQMGGTGDIQLTEVLVYTALDELNFSRVDDTCSIRIGRTTDQEKSMAKASRKSTEVLAVELRSGPSRSFRAKPPQECDGQPGPHGRYAGGQR